MLCRRQLCVLRRAPEMMALNSAMACFVAMLVGGAFWQVRCAKGGGGQPGR
jgi:hypothetical protein